MLHRCIDVDNHSSYYLGDTMIKKGMQDYSNVLLQAKQMMRALKVVHPEATFEQSLLLPSEVKFEMRQTDFTVSIFIPENVNTANYSFAQGVYGVMFDVDSRMMSLTSEVY
jgi:hypothetical protein